MEFIGWWKMFRKKLEKQVKKHEGVSDKLYTCTQGKLTIGVGYNIEDRGLPDEVIDYLYKKDITRIIQEALEIYPEFSTYPDNVKIVICDMLMMGKTRYMTFKNMIKAIKEHDWVTAAHEMKDSRWYHQVGHRSEFLCKQMLEGVSDE